MRGENIGKSRIVNNKFPTYVGVMRPWIPVSLLSAVMLGGCSEENPWKSHAGIDDLNPSRYHVVAVDGKPEKRAGYWMHNMMPVNMLPWVLVDPGIHSLTTKCSDDMGIPTVTFTTSLKVGKIYRIAATGASLIEMEPSH